MGDRFADIGTRLQTMNYLIVAQIAVLSVVAIVVIIGVLSA